MYTKVNIVRSKDKTYRYLYIVESYRDKNKKPRQRLLFKLGNLDEMIKTGKLDSLIRSLSKHSKTQYVLEAEEGVIEDARILGSVLAVEKIFKELGLEEKLRQLQRERRIKYDFVRAVKLMVLNRVIYPASKLATERWKEELYNAEEYEGIKLQHLYRTLDILVQEDQGLKEHLYRKQLELFRPEVRVVYYDLTTLYFESEVEDELKRYGFSKDKRNDCVQVVLGVVLSGDGTPIDYQVHPGNTFEGKTVIETVKRLRAEYDVEKVIFVGDRGLVSKKNLEELERLGCGYVIAARVKKLSEDVKEKIAKEEGWEKIDERLEAKELRVDERKLVVYRDQELARLEKERRKELLEWLGKQIQSNPKRLMSKRSYSRYLHIEGAKISLNLEAIRKEERLDGVFGFWCGDEAIGKEEAYRIYKGLWQVEDAFRSMKSYLRVRPIYHWSPDRVLGHMVLCYMAFCVLKAMEKKLRAHGLDISPRRAIEKLSRVRSVGIVTDKGRVRFRTEVKGELAELFRALGVRIPPVILSVQEA